MKYVAPQVASWSDELFVIAASISHKRGPKGFRSAVEHVVSQTSPTRTSQVDAWPASTAPCLQVADYCCWAIHRKWERSDARSYELVKDKIRSEYDIFRGGNTLYYYKENEPAIRFYPEEPKGSCHQLFCYPLRLLEVAKAVNLAVPLKPPSVLPHHLRNPHIYALGVFQEGETHVLHFQHRHNHLGAHALRFFLAGGAVVNAEID